MGNFLVIVSADDLQDEAERLFSAGLELAHCLKNQVASQTVKSEWARAAVFARHNGSSAPIVSDPATGSWLLAAGTWFHSEDYGPGSEARLLERYLQVGPTQLGRELEGFFVVVVGDARTWDTVVITDLVGSCHAFSRGLDRITALSGSSLMLAGLGKFTLDPIACQEFLRTGVIYEDRTFYSEVRKLGAATVFRFAKGARHAERRYWQISELVPESLGGQKAAGVLGEVLSHAAKKIGRYFKHPVCDLTGGYDSRAVVAAFLTGGVGFSTTVSGPASSPDVVISHSLARLAGLPHMHLESTEQLSFEDARQAFLFTDGEYDLVEYARILKIHRTLAERFDISINGSFGEIARGYWWELLWPHAGRRNPLESMKIARLRYAVQPHDASLFPSDMRLDLVGHFTGVIDRTNAGLAHLPNTMQMDHAYLMMRMQRWQGRIASSTDQLWPCLSPFLFRSVLETMLQTRTRLRRRSLLIRQMLAERQPRLADYPLEHGHPALPVTWKSFHRFIPLVGHYGRKVMSRVSRLRNNNSQLPAAPPSHLPARLQLLQEEGVKDLLDTPALKVSLLLDPAALGAFLRRSHQQDFPFGDQWARLLSLEYTLRNLESIRPAR